jgi:hypothetical protein
MEIRNMTIAPATASASALIYGPTSQRPATLNATDPAQLPFQAVLDQQATLQASLPSAATTTAIASSLTSPATAPVLPPRQGNFVSFEMSAIGGKVTSLNVAGEDNDSLQVGDQWQLSIVGGPPNTELKQLLSNTAYPPPYQTVGTTDAHGNLTLTITATADQVGTRPYLPYYMQFPNAAGVPSYDPTAPPGYHNALVALVAYDVHPAGTGSPLTVPIQPPTQASLPPVATPTVNPSTVLSSATATAPVLPPRQGNFVSFEMGAIGGKVTSLNVAGDDNDSLQVGDQWQLSIVGGPPNTELKQLLSNTVYPPPFQTVGKTDANGNLTLTITATADQVGSRPYLPYYMQFPNTTAVSYDPTAPPGYHNALVALVTYDVNPAGTASPLTVPLQPAATETVSLPSAAASAVTAAAVQPVEVAQPLDRVSEVASTAAVSDTQSTVARSVDGILQDLKQAAASAGVSSTSDTGAGAVSWTPVDWNWQLQQLANPPEALALNQLFPRVALNQPMTLPDFWNTVASSIRT